MEYKWYELQKRKADFIKIVELLLRFDEKTNRHKTYKNPELHWMRRAIVAACQEDVRIFLNRLSEWLYYIVVELKAKDHFLATSWLHEDGILLERKTAPDDHPIQRIVCLSDLFALASPLPLDLNESLLDSVSLNLMEADFLEEAALERA